MTGRCEILPALPFATVMTFPSCKPAQTSQPLLLLDGVAIYRKLGGTIHHILQRNTAQVTPLPNRADPSKRRSHSTIHRETLPGKLIEIINGRKRALRYGEHVEHGNVHGTACKAITSRSTASATDQLRRRQARSNLLQVLTRNAGSLSDFPSMAPAPYRHVPPKHHEAHCIEPFGRYLHWCLLTEW